ncbi:MAG: N-acetylmannosamine-6-phosphate 2-epimerase [Eubacteriales bacterium]|nr:N-acetylmannosamine-6-phosphate 2-epimerase [Eubacteriales bacterium]
MNQANEAILSRIKGGLIVSCQALKEEPLYSSYIMSRMAYAAMLGGAVGIRANTIADITEIKKTVSLPIIGIIKEVYGDCSVYITPTMKEVDALAECGVSIIACDATDSDRRPRPDGKSLDEFFGEVREKYPDQLFMADCSSYEEGIHAAQIGFDLIGTTMNGYTEYTKGAKLPNIELMGRLARDCGKPVIAEGGIWLPDQLKAALDAGVWAAVIGGAITRPMEITKRFVAAIK